MSACGYLTSSGSSAPARLSPGHTARIVSPMDGPTLRRLRKRAKLTQRGLAERLSVRENTVARWERNEMRIRPPMVRLIHLLLAPRTGKADKRAC